MNEEEDFWTCPACDCANDNDWVKCSNCGRPIDWAGVWNWPGNSPRRARNPKRSTRRRVHGDHQARKFWEACIICGIQQHNGFYGRAQILENADAALEAWRERWEKPAEVHSPDYVPPEKEGGNDHAAPDFPEQHQPHRFVADNLSPFCTECGGGKLHSIHQVETLLAKPESEDFNG